MTSKFERDKVYKTRDGREARVICVDAPGNWQIIALVKGKERWFIERYEADGGWSCRVGSEGAADLMLPKPEPVVEWGRIDSRGDFRRAPTEAAARDPVCWCKSPDERTWHLAKRVTTFED